MNVTFEHTTTDVRYIDEYTTIADYVNCECTEDDAEAIAKVDLSSECGEFVNDYVRCVVKNIEEIDDNERDAIYHAMSFTKIREEVSRYIRDTEDSLDYGDYGYCGTDKWN